MSPRLIAHPVDTPQNVASHLSTGREPGKYNYDLKSKALTTNNLRNPDGTLREIVAIGSVIVKRDGSGRPIVEQGTLVLPFPIPKRMSSDPKSGPALRQIKEYLGGLYSDLLLSLYPPTDSIPVSCVVMYYMLYSIFHPRNEISHLIC